MRDVPLHVVLGAGQVGLALATRLQASGLAVQAVSRSRPGNMAEAIEWRGADLADPKAAIEAPVGATVVYQCLNALYTRWPEPLPPLQRSVLGAAEHASALLVTLENVYG